MMRICPNCKKKLGQYDYYFCSSCANPLPADLVNKSHEFRKVMDLQTQATPTQSFFTHVGEAVRNAIKIINPLYVLFSAIGILTVGLTATYFYTRFTSPALKLKNQSIATFSTANVLKVDSEFKSHVFGADKIADYIPFDIDLYIEGHDMDKSVALYGQFDLFYSKLREVAKQVFGQHYAVFAKEIDGQVYWSVIAFDITKQTYDYNIMFNDFPWLNHAIANDAIIITTSNDILKESSESAKKIAKNLSMNPSYAIARNTGPKSGQFLIISFNEKGKEVLKMLEKNRKVPEDFAKVVKAFNKANLNFAIIQ